MIELPSAPTNTSARLLFVALFALLGCQAASQPETRTDADTVTTEDSDAGSTESPIEVPDAEAPDAASADATSADAASADDAALSTVPPGRPNLCYRPGDDVVRDLFCGATLAAITGLRPLQSALHLNVIPDNIDDATAINFKPDPFLLIDQMVLLGHSTALGGRVVSPINPRVLLLSRPAIMAFQRGIQQVELAAADRSQNRFNFYLVTFRQACNDARSGCLPGDLYTPEVERNWRDVQINDDEELKNTPSDCRQCHGRVRGRMMLLMRELQGPWTHFFGGDTDPTVMAYSQTRSDELYAGIPAWAMAHTAGGTLQNLVELTQPLEFPTPRIEDELAAHDPAAGPRRSPTWDAAYQAFKRGEQLPLPYFEAQPTDAAKQAKLSQAYRRYRMGELPASELPDLADIFPDDAQVRAEIGLQTEPNASPAQTLIQACGPCHNDALDQTLSRARFNIGLARMSRSELDLAIGRLSLPAHSDGVMPPPDVRQLDAQGRTRLIAFLRQDTRDAQDDAQLDQAAKQGMAKDPWKDLIIDSATEPTYPAKPAY